MDEVVGVGNEMQFCAGNLFCQAVSTVDRDPGVLGAPRDQHRQLDGRVQGFDLVGIALAGLRDLAVEGSLAVGAEPGGASMSRCSPDSGRCAAPVM